MSVTQNGKVICDVCGRFCSLPVDSWTPFGCADPEAPEPYDPSHICKKCFPEVKKDWVKRFKLGYRGGNWQKSRAESEAAKECGLVWVGSSGVGMLGTKHFSDNNIYLPKKIYDNLKKLPYWGYCETCHAKNKGGYCSDPECLKSFEAKKKL